MTNAMSEGGLEMAATKCCGGCEHHDDHESMMRFERSAMLTDILAARGILDNLAREMGAGKAEPSEAEKLERAREEGRREVFEEVLAWLSPVRAPDEMTACDDCWREVTCEKRATNGVGCEDFTPGGDDLRAWVIERMAGIGQSFTCDTCCERKPADEGCADDAPSTCDDCHERHGINDGVRSAVMRALDMADAAGMEAWAVVKVHCNTEDDEKKADVVSELADAEWTNGDSRTSTNYGKAFTWRQWEADERCEMIVHRRSIVVDDDGAF